MTFDIDANGIVNVSARDKGTGREQQSKKLWLVNCLLAKMGKYYLAGQGLMHLKLVKGSKIVINNQAGIARSMVSANQC